MVGGVRNRAAGKAAAKAAGKAAAKAAAKAMGKAAAKAAGKAAAKAAGKAAAKAVAAKAKAKAAAVAPQPLAAAPRNMLSLFVTDGVANAPAAVVFVSTAATLGDVMSQVEAQEGIPPAQQRFVVEDGRTLSDYRHTVGVPPVSIPVETPAGTLWLEARHLLDWRLVRTVISDAVGIAPHEQVLRSRANGSIVVTVGAAGSSTVAADFLGAGTSTGATAAYSGVVVSHDP
jgi:hypothetical protein